MCVCVCVNVCESELHVDVDVVMNTCVDIDGWIDIIEV